jgi:hypothetical protein
LDYKYTHMCKILAPTTWELVKFHAKLTFSVEAADAYAQQLLWQKLLKSLGENVNKYIDELNLIVLSIWIEEDESEVSYLEQAVENFFLYGFEMNSEVIKKRQYIEDRFLELFREELYSACTAQLPRPRNVETTQLILV